MCVDVVDLMRGSSETPTRHQKNVRWPMNRVFFSPKLNVKTHSLTGAPEVILVTVVRGTKDVQGWPTYPLDVEASTGMKLGA